MSSSDSIGDMNWIDENSVDALLQGKLDPNNVPKNLQGVHSLVQVIRNSNYTVSSPSENEIVSHFRNALNESLLAEKALDRKRRRSAMIGKLLTLKSAVLAGSVLVGGSALAAATGNLPAPVQVTLASGAKHIGLAIPDPSNSSATGNKTPGPKIDSHNSFGLCTAYMSVGKESNSSSPSTSEPPAYTHSKAFQSLTNTASSSNESVSQYCQTVIASKNSSKAKGSDSSEGDSNSLPSSTHPSEGDSNSVPSSTQPSLGSTVPTTQQNPSTVPTSSTPVSTVPQTSVTLPSQGQNKG